MKSGPVDVFAGAASSLVIMVVVAMMVTLRGGDGGTGGGVDAAAWVVAPRTMVMQRDSGRGAASTRAWWNRHPGSTARGASRGVIVRRMVTDDDDDAAAADTRVDGATMFQGVRWDATTTTTTSSSSSSSTANYNDQSETSASKAAATGTVNERLLIELQQAADQEKFGPRSDLGKKMGWNSFRSSKTDVERKAAIAEARDLNGVSPFVALAGALFALGGAAGLWFLTQFLAEYFALHPTESNIYFVTRVSAVFRNVIVGLVSLASGFFGVTGVGLFLLAVRVAYGVARGELDPTPIRRAQKEEDDLDVSSVWDMMLNKKTKRGRR